MGVLCLLGLVGNTVSTLCLYRDSSKTATPFLLISLEVADTSFLVCVFLIRVLTSIHTFTVPIARMSILVPYLTKYVYPLAIVAETSTIYLTILVTVNRYVSVCWPYRASDWCSLTWARRHVIAVGLFAAVINLPRFFEYDIVTRVTTKTMSVSMLGRNDNTTTMTTSPGVDNSTTSPSVRLAAVLSSMTASPIYQFVYSYILYVVVMFLVPLVSLSFLNQRLAIELRRTRRKRARLRGCSPTVVTSPPPASLAPPPLPAGGSGGGGANGDDIVVADGGSSSNRVPAVAGVAAVRTDGSGTGRRRRSSEDDITMMLIVVVIVFVVTQTPAAVTQILQNIVDQRCMSVYFFYSRLSDLLVVANSSVNFIIYCMCSRRFRRVLYTLLYSTSTGTGATGPAADNSHDRLSRYNLPASVALIPRPCP